MYTSAQHSVCALKRTYILLKTVFNDYVILFLQCAHIMAMAVQRLHKGAQCTIGPWIERGFYYDFAMPAPLTEKDLPKIRKEMQKIIRRNLPLVREEVPADEARRRITEAGEPYKLEILDSIVER